MKKGFTLIELLAVIVILAILALIVSPIISGVITDAKKAAAERSMEGYVKAVEFAQVEYQGKNKGVYATGIDNLSVEYSGNEVLNTTVVFKEGTVETAQATISGYICVYENKKAECNKNMVLSLLPSGLNKGSAVYFNPETKKICNESDAVSTTGTKTGCMKWYVYKNNGNGTYQLILDHNTTAHVAWTIDISSDTGTWESSLNARLITADEIAEITNNTTFNGETSDRNSGFYLDTNNQTAPSEFNYGWLYDYTSNCVSTGCSHSDSSAFGYWTSTSVYNFSGSVWRLGMDDGVFTYNASDTSFYGIRPVITA